MLGAKRWSAQDSLKADLIEEACSESELFSKSLAFAEQEARLASVRFSTAFRLLFDCFLAEMGLL